VNSAVGRQTLLERELQAKGRLQDANRLEEERRQAEEIEAAIDQAFDVEKDAACDLLNIRPTTLAGVIALLAHARDYDTDGMGWPDQLVDSDWRAGHAADCVEDTRSWQYFLIANLTEILPAVMS
jgi:hypothetical protein